MTIIPAFFKDQYSNYVLNKEIPGPSRNKEAVNLSMARTVGIVYMLGTHEDYRSVEKFVRFLQDKDIRVKAMGYVRDKYLTRRYLPKLTYDFFYTRDLNWYHKPGGTYVKEFLKNRYDIFMDLSSGDIFPLRYLSAKATAKLKVGRYNEKNKAIFDLLIRSEKQQKMESYIQEVKHYLSVINK